MAELVQFRQEGRTNSAAIFAVTDMQVMAAAIAKSSLFGMKTEDQALALMLVAQAEGCHPATITQDYDIIQGKACRKTHSVLARFQQMGGRVEWHELTDRKAEATFSHPSGGSLRLSWTIEQAQKAGLTNKDNWKNYPRAMLRARLVAEGVRAVYPAAIGGLMVAEEAQDIPDTPPRDMGSVVRVDEPKTLPTYPDDKFENNLSTWRKSIASGRNTPDSIISKVSSSYALTEDQKAAIRADVNTGEIAQ